MRLPKLSTGLLAAITLSMGLAQVAHAGRFITNWDLDLIEYSGFSLQLGENSAQLFDSGGQLLNLDPATGDKNWFAAITTNYRFGFRDAANRFGVVIAKYTQKPDEMWVLDEKKGTLLWESKDPLGQVFLLSKDHTLAFNPAGDALSVFTNADGKFEKDTDNWTNRTILGDRPLENGSFLVDEKFASGTRRLSLLRLQTKKNAAGTLFQTVATRDLYDGHYTVVAAHIEGNQVFLQVGVLPSHSDASLHGKTFVVSLDSHLDTDWKLGTDFAKGTNYYGGVVNYLPLKSTQDYLYGISATKPGKLIEISLISKRSGKLIYSGTVEDMVSDYYDQYFDSKNQILYMSGSSKSVLVSEGTSTYHRPMVFAHKLVNKKGGKSLKLLERFSIPDPHDHQVYSLRGITKDGSVLVDHKGGRPYHWRHTLYSVRYEE